MVSLLRPNSWVDSKDFLLLALIVCSIFFLFILFGDVPLLQSAMAIMDESGNWRVVYQRPAAARTTSSRLSAPQLRYPTALGGTLHSMEETA